ncbi:BQ5605_C002g01159 [Microbotryum silenes-dioicae]|uniref:BQ5605_C002g01159 protein n=1 Tax=Microbotryum silenes-dioicae TaxID=796604 RepID=A0A2X0P191_9BASI|nr:BQ5605_C002g01159 [Microbotryum silenes-dioicae]
MQPLQSTRRNPTKSSYFISRQVPAEDLDDDFTRALTAGASAVPSSTPAALGARKASKSSLSLLAIHTSPVDAHSASSPRQSLSSRSAGAPGSPHSPILPRIPHQSLGLDKFNQDLLAAEFSPLASHSPRLSGGAQRNRSDSFDTLDMTSSLPISPSRIKTIFGAHGSTFSEAHLAADANDPALAASRRPIWRSRRTKERSLDDPGLAVSKHPPRGMKGPTNSRLVPRSSSASLGEMTNDLHRRQEMVAPNDYSKLPALTLATSDEAQSSSHEKEDEDEETEAFDDDDEETAEVEAGGTRWAKTGVRGETYTVELGSAVLDDDESAQLGAAGDEDDEGPQVFLEASQFLDPDSQGFVEAESPPQGQYAAPHLGSGEATLSPASDKTPRTSPVLTRASVEEAPVRDKLSLLAVGTAPVITPSTPSPPPTPAHTTASFAPPSPSTGSTSSPVRSSADFVVAVVGPRGVGKSTVIRRGLKKPAARPVVLAQDDQDNRVTTCTSHFTIAGQARSIEVLEIDMGLLEYNSEGVIWPEGLPPCEGAMLCYESTDPRALDSLSRLLQAFWTRGSDVPLIVLACKANADLRLNATDPNKAAAVCNIYGAGIVSLDGGPEDRGRKMKESFNWMIRTIMDNRGESRRAPSAASSRNRKHSSVDGTSAAASMKQARPSSGRRTSLPASDPVTFSDPFDGGSSHASANPSAEDGDQPRRVSRTDPSLGLGRSLAVVEEAPLAEVTPPFRRPSTQGGLLGLHITAEDPTASAPAAAAATPATASTTEADKAVTRRSTSIRISPSRVSVDFGGKVARPPSLDLFFSRDDMIDKFLFASVTGNDDNYVTLFLIVFRRFARPFDVLSKLIERFTYVAGRLRTDPLLSRFAQMKLCGTLSVWFTVYPGDFSAPATSALLQPFLEGLLPSGATWVAHYAVDMLPKLADVSRMNDPESTWALPDKRLDSVEPTDDSVPFPSVGQTPAAGRQPSAESRTSRLDKGIESLRRSNESHSSINSPSSHLELPASNRLSDLTPPPSSSASEPTRERTDSETPTIATLDTSAGDTNSINNDSIGSTTGSSTSWRKRPSSLILTLLDASNALMDVSEEAIATQITRLTWMSFADITPRDLIRHVLAPRDPSDPSRAMRDEDSSVKRSIAFVNYLANWVASMTLVQPKLKWRVRMLEKLIGVAYHLREQENFDALMGVLAGLNLQPLYRMKELKETVWVRLGGDHENAPKRLRSLYRLMAHTKSFAAYRLAIASSGSNMLPYLGVHLQDITTINEIKSDMRDGKVNWSKFQKMGESAAVVLDCARLSPTLPIDPLIERCILDALLLSEQEQYDLSKAYEPLGTTTTSRGSGRTAGARAKFRNLTERSAFFA